MQGKRPYYWGLIPGFRDYDAAIDLFEKMVKNAPFSKQAPKALMFISHLSKKYRKVEDAWDALERIINEYPNSSQAEEAYLVLAETYAESVQGPAYDQGA